MREGWLFVLFVVTLNFLKPCYPCYAFGTVGKPLTSRGAPSWLHNVSTCGEEIIEYSTFNSKPKIINYLIALLVFLESFQ
jgi:hypothetical protein